VDVPVYTFAELRALTGYGAPFLYGLRQRKQWVPERKQPQFRAAEKALTGGFALVERRSVVGVTE
jgi:hypothetical protein